MIFLSALVILTSCTNQNQQSMSAENMEIVKQYYSHFNNHNWKKMAGMYTVTADFKDPSLEQGIVKQTREQTIQKYSELSTMFPDIQDEVVQIYPSGDKHVVVEFVSRGTAPDGSKFELPICTIFTIEDGLITKDFTYYDNFGE
nr:nuclear transport factor 2 family protein [Pontibacter ruber]